MTTTHRHPSSYRDPAGYVFLHNGRPYRQVHSVYAPHYERLMSSGLYEELVTEGMLLPHREAEGNLTGDAACWRTLEPEILPFISYPYEWSFGQLRDAALLTLEIMRRSLEKGMILKDATPYNIQLHGGRNVFIDTLSFEIYDPASPWIAYRQFCESFLAPLLLMHYSGQPLQPLLVAYPEGIPLPTAAALLPRRSRWQLHVYLHVHLHARMSQKAPQDGAGKQQPFSLAKMQHILRSLTSLVSSLSLRHRGVWAAYYDEASGRNDYLVRKQEVLSAWFDDLPGVESALDAGANDGTFSRMLAARGIRTLSADSEHAAVNALYMGLNKQPGLYPLLIDFSNPSPAIGVNNRERPAFLDRARTDLVVALAFIHHLCIGRNIPFDDVAQLFHRLAPRLILEFVPRDDEKVRYMLSQKADIYEWYTEEGFTDAFAKWYRVLRREPVGSSGRVLYSMIAHEIG